MRKQHYGYLVCLLAMLACSLPSQAPTATPTPSIPTATETPAFTSTPTTYRDDPTITFTPTITLTPTITATPTFAFPTVTVNKQAHCRYGPAVALSACRRSISRRCWQCARKSFIQQMALHQIRQDRTTSAGSRPRLWIWSAILAILTRSPQTFNPLAAICMVRLTM